MTPVVLTIAGSDPSGGAGIQSDLRTFAALGVIGVSVITALTVQNSLGVQSVFPVPADVLAAQLEAIFSDTNVAAVKIGMLGGADQVGVVAAALRKYKPPHIVLDPVLASSGGVALLDVDGQKLLLTELLPLCELVTPNVPELGHLAGKTFSSESERKKAVQHLQSLCATAVLVKGGHLPKAPIDRLFPANGKSVSFYQSRIETTHTHGTGCLLSAAIASSLAKGVHLEKAIYDAKQVVTSAIQYPVVIGRGSGYPDVARGIEDLAPRPLFFRTHAERITLLSGLYVVTAPDLRLSRTAEETAWAAMDGGAKTVQLRDKDMPLQRLVILAQKMRSSTFSKMLFIVNDRVDIALASNADGVHLGPDDMAPEDARLLLGPDKLVGVSVATLEEAKAAAPYASYFGVGAIFGTKTKKDAGAAIGAGRLREIKAAFPNIPIVAIGGINLENIAKVAAAGADAAAVVSAVVSAPDMVEATRELSVRFAEGKEKAMG